MPHCISSQTLLDKYENKEEGEKKSLPNSSHLHYHLVPLYILQHNTLTRQVLCALYWIGLTKSEELPYYVGPFLKKGHKEIEQVPHTAVGCVMGNYEPTCNISN